MFRPSWEHGYAEEDIKSTYFSEDQAEMASVVETEAAVDPIQLLAHEFPGFAVESLADILRANGGDLGLTIEMLIQLEVWGSILCDQTSLSLSFIQENLFFLLLVPCCAFCFHSDSRGCYASSSVTFTGSNPEPNPDGFPSSFWVRVSRK